MRSDTAAPCASAHGRGDVADRWRDARVAGPAFFGHADQTALDVALHVLDEFSHHAAELGVLRDLYAHRPVDG